MPAIPKIPVPVHPGVMAEVIRNPSAFLLKLATLAGDIGEYKAGPVHIVCVNAPELVHQVLVSKAAHFRKMAAVRTLGAFTGDGLVVSEGPTWERHRKLAAPAFHHQRIAQYFGTFVSLANEAQAGWRDGEVIDLGEHITRLTLRMVAQTLFSCDLDDIYAGMSRDIEHALAYVNTLSARSAFPGGTWFIRGRAQAKAAMARVDASVRKLIAARRSAGKDTGDLLSMLMLARGEGDPGLSDDELRNEAITMFVAGHETIAAALVWSLVLLHQHPAAAQRIRDEAAVACGTSLPELHHAADLPFALQVFKETLRLYPPVFVVGREAIETVAIGDWHIAKNAWVMIAPSVIHRNPALFANPEAFAPERLTPEFEKALPRGGYLPFGMGPRICIGNAFSLMEGQAVLATLAPRVSLELTGPPPGVKPMITLGPDVPVLARVRRLTGAGGARSAG